jgi:lysozyme
VTTPRLITDLRFDEAVGGVAVLEAYPDPRSGADPWTIGYGHTGPEVHPGLTWTPEQCEAALSADVARAERSLDSEMSWWRGQDDLRQDVLANMCFNMGAGKLSGFHQTLAAVQARDYETAATEMLDSSWARQVGHRARRLAEQMRTGVHA